ncbi:Maf family nucleotide pyrophosphatase [Pleionea sp. CnH1-48]|uniref:Maf family protein n=1 Tax=Pleionea sp. CnH1-48 TaxID=2954494 RepID=UPI0020968E8E|nr:Maf family nucleotide pyrophosphatase [Pleionea sp. CnH1-48]
MNYRIVLASSSVYRANLLKQIGIFATCISPNIDETPLISEQPEPLSLRLAKEKCMAVYEQLRSADKPSIIIAADQVACCGPKVLSKPGTEQKARQQLTLLSGNQAHFFTGLYMLNTQTEQSYFHLDPVSVKFRSLSEQEINQYIAIEQPLDCAGSFKCEGLGICLFEEIQSQDPSSLIGLPLIAVANGLRQLGVNPILDAANPATETNGQ